MGKFILRQMMAVTVMKCGNMIPQQMPVLQTLSEFLIYALVVLVKMVFPGQRTGLYGIINFILLVTMAATVMKFTAMMVPALQE